MSLQTITFERIDTAVVCPKCGTERRLRTLSPVGLLLAVDEPLEVVHERATQFWMEHHACKPKGDE